MKQPTSLLSPSSVFSLIAVAGISSNAYAQEEAPADVAEEAPAGEAMTEEDYEAQFLAEVEKFGWQREGVGKLKDEGEIDIPPGFRFSGPEGAQGLMELYGNPPTDREYGVIAPENLDWCVLFEFDESGYVKDDEKDSIDPEKLLKGMRDTQDAANEYRRENGMDELNITGWAHPPYYNEDTNNLEWALTLESSSGGSTVNYNTRLLGRYGVMESVLICNPEDLESILSTYQGLIAGYRYQDGHQYAQYQDGDKLAKYGLTALIVGGGTAVAAKTGLLAGLIKIISKGGKAAIAGIIALFAGIVAGFKRLFGNG